MGMITRFLGKGENRPVWLRIVRGLAGTAVLLFVVLPLLIALLALVLVLRGDMTWDLVEIPWLIAVDLLPLVTEPVRDFLADHAAGLPVSGDVLWQAWRLAAVAILIVGFTGALWARTARVALVLGTAAMMCTDSSDAFSQVTIGVTVVWLSIEAFLLYRRSDRLRRAVRKRTRPEPPAFADDHLELTVLPDQIGRAHV